jgi:uncharacterized membrane protein YgdD (TMEM256/DUF423 family)
MKPFPQMLCCPAEHRSIANRRMLILRIITSRFCYLLAGLTGATAVVLGALTAHSFPESYDADQIHSLETAVRFQFFHALLLLAAGILLERYHNFRRWYLQTMAGLTFLGTLLFSGSIYGLVLGGQLWFGPVTPMGGLLLIIAWVFLILAFLNGRNS